MSDLKGCPITPEEVVAGYQKLNLKPIRGEFVTKDNNGTPIACCAFTVAVVTRGIMTVEQVDELVNSTNGIAKVLDLSSTEFDGFVSGFDGSSYYDDQPDEYKHAYDCGKAAWNAVIEAGLRKE